MNDIINVICIGLSCCSLFPLALSLFKTAKAYKKHKELKNELAKSKDYELKKIEEIIITQKEILEILEDKKYLEKIKSLDFEKEKLEKSKKELQNNFLNILKVSEDKRA